MTPFEQQCFLVALPVLMTWAGYCVVTLVRLGNRVRELEENSVKRAEVNGLGARVRLVETNSVASQSKIEFYDHWFKVLALQSGLEPWAKTGGKRPEEGEAAGTRPGDG